MTDNVTGNDSPIQGAFKIDEAQVRGHVEKVVRESVEQTLNGLLDAEAKQLCGAGKYERTDARKDTRAGRYSRKLQTKAGEVTLKVPRLRSLPFETQIIERYKRRDGNSALMLSAARLVLLTRLNPSLLLKPENH